MELSKEKHQRYLGLLKGRAAEWAKHTHGAHEYEVMSSETGKFLFYRKDKGSKENTQIATIDLTGARCTMRQNANAPKDLQVLKSSALYMCQMLKDSNPDGNYTLKFTGPDAEEIGEYVKASLLKNYQSLSNFTLQVEGVQSVRPSPFGRSSSPSSAALGSGLKESSVGQDQGSGQDDPDCMTLG